MGVFAFIFGCIWGSFLNVLIDRLPNGQNVLWGRSHCDYCKRNLRWYELIPIFSFLVLRGKCLRCHRSLSWQYPIVELVTGAGFYILYQSVPSFVALIPDTIIFCSLLVIFMADVKYQIIPDSMTIVGSIGAFILLYLTQMPRVIVNHGITAVVVFLFFYALWFFTKKKGIGFGDVKFSFLLGFLLGYPESIFALYIAFLTGAATGVILILGRKKTMKSAIAFGPFLVFGVGAALVFHNQLIQIWYSIF